MEDINWGLAIFSFLFAGAITLILARRDVLDWFRRRGRGTDDLATREARRKEDRARWDAYVAKAKASGPPMTAQDADDLQAWLKAAILPYVALHPGAAPPPSPTATRIGGQPFLPEGTDWPRDREGRPMNFLAQINFAEMPKLPDYPEAGLLLIFIEDNDHMGANFGLFADTSSPRLILTDPASPGRLVRRPNPPSVSGPFVDGDVEVRGRAVTFSTGEMQVPSNDWRIEKRWPGWWAREGDERFHDLAERDDENDPRPPFYIGGHMRFIHDDIRREDEALHDFDRVLLQLDSEHGLQWGDVGMATFLIRREDLLALNFSRVIFTWDSH